MAYTHAALTPLAAVPVTTVLPLLALAFLASRAIYRLFLHPLSHVPGPLLARVTHLPLYLVSYLGVEGRVLRYYHRKLNTKVLRIAPDHVSISDSAAVQQIYVSGGGFQKDARYRNFNLGPIATIFSAQDAAYRDRRAKAVAPLFATAAVRAACEPGGAIGECVDEFVEQLRRIKASGTKRIAATADILDLAARLSIDVVTGYLLQRRYGGLQEHVECVPTGPEGGDGTANPSRHSHRPKLSANHFIFAIVAFGRFSLLPNWLFRVLYATSTRLSATDEFKSSLAKISQFAEGVVAAVDPARGGTGAEDVKADAKSNYQSRLLSAGISRGETIAQCEAIIFAGADSTALMLATIMFHLVQNPAVRQRLRDEIRNQPGGGASPGLAGLQSLPYLRAVVKEGLRLGMANPTRYTRVVPAGGLRLDDGTYIPPGTVVGTAAYVLHHDPDVFPEPFAFRPERWLGKNGGEEGRKRPTNASGSANSNGGGEAAEELWAASEKSFIPFGAGSRACIGKVLATHQLYATVKALIESGVLEGARTCKDRIDIIEWFNAEIRGHELNIEWPASDRTE